jgi:crotonobetainyl-CoA:carnitine CoA-transferase CaiB-like acyl-CoA transferase
MLDPRAITAELCRRAALPAAVLDQLDLTGSEPALPSSFRVGAAAQATIAAAGLAAAEIWRRRSGAAQRVGVDMRHAAVEFRSEHYVSVVGGTAGARWSPIAGAYRTADGWVRLHTNFPHHRDGILHLLGCGESREAVAAVLATRRAEAFETEATAAGLCVAAMRDFATWDAHPQARALAPLPPLALERVGAAPAEGFSPGADRPLGGVRVLDLTRVIAGPVAGRTLAAHGAEVLHLTAPDLPNFADLLPDTGRGKRTAFVDLKTEAGRAALRELVRGADVLLQSYRPGALAAHGFGPDALAALRPGLVIVTLSAYGEAGPWAGKRGFDSLVQTATGFNAAVAAAAGVEGPKVLPCQALDHASGFLLALGAMAGLLRRAEEGGTWRATVALATTGQWLRGLGRLEGGFAAPDPKAADVADLLETTDSGFGRLTAVRHAAMLAATPARWTVPAMPLGATPAAW